MKANNIPLGTKVAKRHIFPANVGAGPPRPNSRAGEPCPYLLTGRDIHAEGNKGRRNAKAVLSIALFFALILAPSFASAQGIITTVAGTGVAGYSGDGGPATQAQLFGPYSATVDSTGNLYIADTFNHRIRKVDENGIISAVAGSGPAGEGSGGFSGDGGLATQAQLNTPTSITLDNASNLYISDHFNHRVRKVDLNGIITTIAGSGPTGLNTGGFSGDGGPATQAQLSQPRGLTVDHSGSIYIADRLNHRVRKIDASGIITTVAGNGIAGFSGDSGPAAQAQLNYPAGVAFDISGNLYIADFNNHRVRKVNTSGTISTVAGTGIYGFSGDGGPATQAQIDTATGVAFDSSGNLYIADIWNNRVRKVDTNGIISTVAGIGSPGFSGDGGPATQAQLSQPIVIAVDRTGNLFIVDNMNHRVRKVTFAAALATGTISGRVTDSSTGSGISGATVSTTTGGYWATTDASGNYTLSNVAAGTYTINISAPGFQSSSQSGVSVTAGLTTTLNQSLTPLPAITLNPTSLSFSAAQGGANPANQTFTVRNTGGGTLNYAISDDAPWLTVSPNSGTAMAETDTITVSLDISGLSAGTHVSTITVSDPNATNSPQTIQVTLNLSAPRPPQVTEVRIEPANVNFSAIGQTRQLMATAVFNDGTTRDVTNESNWQSFNPAVATVTGTGFVTALAAGETSVNATYQGIIGSATINVSPPRVIEVRISPPSTNFTALGQTGQLRATAAFSDGTTRDVTNEASWLSLNPSIVTVTGTGFITTISAGQTTVQATLLGVTGMAAISVRPPEVTEVRISLPSASFTATGQTAQLRATATFSDGTIRDVTNEVSWQSLNPAIATVTGTGFVTAISAGETTVQATLQGVTGRASISVRPPQVIEVRVAPPISVFTAIGQTAQLSATAIFLDGTSRDVTNEASWGSLNSAIATVTGIGFVTAISAGQTTVQAAFQEVIGSARISVQPVTVTLTPSNVSIPVGGTVRLGAVTSDGSDASYIFSSGNPSIATVSSDGLVTGISQGTATIRATGGTSGVSATATVTVTPPAEIVVAGIVRIRPQLLAAGFDPTLVDLTDDSFDIIALVRPSAVSVRSVTITQNQGSFRFGMNLSGVLPDGDQLWRATFNFGRGTISDTVLRALWGDQPGEFNVTVIDEAQGRHSFPDLEFGNNPALRETVTSPNLIDRSPGIRRVRPQLLAAGFSPTLIDLSDDNFGIIAILRQGALPIRAVTITQNQGQFALSMDFDRMLENGDQLWRATFTFDRGTITNTVLRALWGDQPGEFNVTVIDEAQGRHSFPDLEFGNNPAID